MGTVVFAAVGLVLGRIGRSAWALAVDQVFGAFGRLALLRGNGGVGLGQGVSQIAEDIGRVVELHELVRGPERPPLAVRILGDDLRAESAERLEGQPLVVVVHDDEIADLGGEGL